MKIRSIFAALTLGGLLASCSGGQQPQQLFNGHDLDGWTLVVDTAGHMPADSVFSVRDGVICIKGNPFGYMRTNRKFKDYRLHAEWRWVGGEGTNSGIFQRVQDGDGVWPVGMECQLKAGNAGWIVGLNGYQVQGAQVEDIFAVKSATSDGPSEKPVGEWNEADIECCGTHILIEINGVVQNDAEGQFSEGYIALQSEGGPLEFRNVCITEL